MPTAALIATQLTDHSARAVTITLGALDVTMLVDIDTVQITEEGPDGTSGMHFTIWDPALTVTVAEGDPVESWDSANGRPMFAGFVQSWSYRPSAIGRYVEVEAIGVEALLDWGMLTTELSWLAAFIGSDPAFYTTVPQAIQMIAAASTGLGPIRTGTSAGQSTQAAPISGVYPSGTPSGYTNPEPLTLTVGMSVRAAIDALWSSLTLTTGLGELPPPLRVTVDYTMGLRVWVSDSQPTDYVNLTIVDTVAGAVATTVLDHETDAASVVRGVLVTASTDETFVSDGSGLLGPIHTFVVSDGWLGYPDVQLSLGRAYLAARALSVRGSLTIGSYNPTTNVRTGSQVVITDAQASLAADSFLIASIRKSFHKTGAGLRQTWTVSYGGFQPSLVRTL